MVKVFISYSHNNKAERDELEKHLAVLKRDGSIDTWHDRRILAGADLDKDIDRNLLDSNIVLLLVSPDFLNSDYCYGKEMQIALERRSRGEAWVIPIILEYCEWLHTPLKDLRACPEDGKPISNYPNPNKAYNEVAADIRKVTEKINRAQGAETLVTKVPVNHKPDTQAPAVIMEHDRSSNLRIRQDFTDFDRAKFKKEAFQYISKYFRNSLEELKQRNPGVDYMHELEANQFSATIYRAGKEIASCIVVNSSRSSSWDAITFSYGKQPSGVNEILAVKNDGYIMFLESLMGAFRGNEPLSTSGAAEHLWKLFISRLQQ